MLIRPDGSFVVVGTTLDPTAPQEDFAVVVYGPDGTLPWVKKHRRDWMGIRGAPSGPSGAGDEDAPAPPG